MPLEHVWFWQPDATNPHVKYGDPAGLVVGKIVGQVTRTDIQIEITHSVHPKFAVGSSCRRCRMKTRDAVIVDGIPQDKQSGKNIMPTKPEGVREVPSAGNEDAGLVPDTYRVFKGRWQTDDSEVKGHFVLMPEKDPAALHALRAYAVSCRSPGKKKDILDWIARIEREIVPQWQKGEHLGSMGRINAGLDRLV